MTWRTIVLVGAAVVILGAVATWQATGGEGYTRWPDEKLARSDSVSTVGEDDLLAEIGFDAPDDAAPAPTIESRFALGLAPGGFDPAHLLSVASLAVVAGAAALAALAGTVRARRARRVAAPSPSSSPSVTESA